MAEYPSASSPFFHPARTAPDLSPVERQPAWPPVLSRMTETGAGARRPARAALLCWRVHGGPRWRASITQVAREFTAYLAGFGDIMALYRRWFATEAVPETLTGRPTSPPPDAELSHRVRPARAARDSCARDPATLGSSAMGRDGGAVRFGRLHERCSV
jgi:hypothetical protein